LQLKKFVIPAIIFSALTVEAFINYYAISKGMSIKKIKGFKTKYYEGELMSDDEIQEQYQLPYEQRTTIKKWIADSKGEVEIRDTVVRWIEIPLEYTGKYIPSGLDGTRIYELNELFSLRNKLVHHKAKIFELVNDSNLEDAEDNNYVTLLEAERAVDVVIKAVKALQQIDNDVDLNWLDQ
jgi:DNA-binding transcriptional MerR regulator